MIHRKKRLVVNRHVSVYVNELIVDAATDDSASGELCTKEPLHAAYSAADVEELLDQTMTNL